MKTRTVTTDFRDSYVKKLMTLYKTHEVFEHGKREFEPVKDDNKAAALEHRYKCTAEKLTRDHIDAIEKILDTYEKELARIRNAVRYDDEDDGEYL